MSETGNKPPVTIDVGVKAALEVKAEIPEKSVGRTIDALVDIIRPFTERRGLKADLIRLQREEVALEIARRARRRAEIENVELNPVPNKMLVPFLEKASLEDMKSEMHDRWAALLLSASRRYQAQHLTFIDILGRLSVVEIKLIEEVCFGSPGFPEMSYPSGHIEENHGAVVAFHSLLATEPAASGEETKAAYDRFIEACKLKYGKILRAVVAKGKIPEGHLGPPGGLIFYYNEWGSVLGGGRESVEILERERLLEIVRTKFPDSGIEVEWFNMTYLGVRFVLNCAPDAAKIAARNRAVISPEGIGADPR
jgi:hypothetical protein